MKTNILFVIGIIALASCSTPKYTYNFDYHDYNAGRRQKEKEAMREVAANPGPVEIQPEALIAEAPEIKSSTHETTPAQSQQGSIEKPVTKFNPLTMSKAERKEMIKEMTSAVKNLTKKQKADVGQSTKVMDHDLKLALVFLIVSIVAGVLYSVSPYLTYIVGTVALILAIVFFIKWLMRQ